MNQNPNIIPKSEFFETESTYIIENVSERLPTPSPPQAGAHLWWGKGPDGGPDGGHDGGHHFLKNEKKMKN